MQIYVGKNGQQLGPFSLEEVNRKLADGTFVGTDLAWYEGAAGWAPISGVPGVVIAAPAPAPAATTPTPAAAPSPAISPISPAVTPVRPNASIVQPPRSNTKTLALVSWVILVLTLILSFIPFLGCGAYLFVWPPALAAIIMGIIIIVRGRVAQGGFIILAAILLIPIALVGPIYTTAMTVGAIERGQEKRILENLRTIDSAKTKWAADTQATAGTTVTMASLSTQLEGKQVNPVVDETYDPMPVGQPPTATLPSGKTLGSFNSGDVLTAANLESALANSSIFSVNWRRTTTSTIGTSPSRSVAPHISPKPSPVPSMTVTAPSASASPKASSPPNSLISPRRSVEPQNSPPSTRPSPSAKFAPRTNPRQAPSPSEDQPSGLKQGRQYPRESPAETPEKDDDDSDE